MRFRYVYAELTEEASFGERWAVIEIDMATARNGSAKATVCSLHRTASEAKSKAMKLDQIATA